MKNTIKDNTMMIHKILNALADNLVKVFVPLLIMKKCNDINLCVMFLVTYSLLTAILNYCLYKPMKNHPMTMIFLHIIPLCILQFIVSLYDVINVPIVILYAILLSLGQTLYSVPSNNYFMFENKKTNAGKMSIGSNIGKFLMIIIGGFIFSTTNLSYIITICFIATILYIFSVYPLIYIKPNYDSTLKELTLREDTNILSKNDKILFRLYHISFGVFQAVIDTILPVFLYTNNLEFEKIAYIMAFVELVKIGMNIFAQKIKLQKLSKVSISLAILFYIASIPALFLVKNNLFLYILSLIINATFPLIFIPNLNKFCSKIKLSNDPQYYMTIRDVEIFSFRPILFIFMLWGNMIGCYILGIISAIIILIVNMNKYYN